MKKNFNGKFLLSSLLLMIGLLIQNPSQAQRKRVTRIDCDGVPVRVGFDISGFHGVETKKIIDVVLIPSDEEKVEVEMWPAFQEFLKVEKKNGVLCFDLRSRERLETTGTCHLTAYVHFTDLRSIAASEAADVSMKGVYDAGGNPFHDSVERVERYARQPERHQQLEHTDIRSERLGFGFGQGYRPEIPRFRCL